METNNGSLDYRFGDPKHFFDERDQFQEDAAYLATNWQSLMELHEGKWVAVDDETLVTVADNYAELFASLAENGVDTRYTIVRHLDPNPRTLIL